MSPAAPTTDVPAMAETVRLTAPCPSHPEDGAHECLSEEMRCAYCGARIDPYPCHGCGQFLTAAQMHEGATRCETCA